MSFVPGRITEKDPFTEETVIKTYKVQANFDLVAQETKRLQDQINVTNKSAFESSERLTRTNYRSAFLFG